MTEAKTTILERVILRNFNSFQNDEVILDSGFTVITGPNGAGKSTIFQGIKFGLSSNERDGRSKKWSDFIRIGSNSGSIELHIRFGDKLYKIRRIIQKGKGPSFQISENFDENKKKSFRNTTVQYIQNLIHTFGYNPDNIFAFVSQGNVISIKNMETKEICEFFELGLGLTDLKSEIQVRKQQIKNLDNQIKSLDSVQNSASYELEILRPKLEKLKKKRILQDEREKLEKEKLFLNRTKIVNEINEIKVIIEDLSSEKETLEEKKGNLQITISELEDSIRDNENSLMELSNEIIKRDYEEKHLADKINEWQKGKDDLADRILITQSLIKRLKAELDILTNELKENENEIIRYQFELSVVNGNKTKILGEFEKYEDARKKYQDLIGQFDDLNDERMKLKHEIDKDQLKINNVENQIKDSMDEIKLLRQELDKFKWFSQDPGKYSFDNLNLQNTKIGSGLDTIERRIKDLEYETLNDEKQLEFIKTAVLMKEIPKSRELNNLIKEINTRSLNVVGPIIDMIDFDPRIGPAVDSILSKFVLNSFITFAKNDFLLVQDLVNKYRAKCNVYQPLKMNIMPNKNLNIEKDRGIYGYLSDFIKPSSNEEEIKKVILSICRNTILVKDKSIGYDYINEYGHQGRIVTLDGTVIRTYKYVIESRSSEIKKKYSNPLEQRKKLNSLKAKLDASRNQMKEYEEKKARLLSAQTTIQSRLNNIKSLNYNYKKLTVTINKKNQLINLKKNLTERKNDLLKSDIALEEQILLLKNKLPINIQDANNFLSSFQQEFSLLDEKAAKINKVLIQKEKDKEFNLNKLKSAETNLEDNEKLEIQIKSEFKESDTEILKMIKEITELKENVENLKINKEKIKENSSNIESTILSEKSHFHRIENELITNNIKIENKIAQIYQKEKFLDEIQISVSELGEKYIERTIEEVENDLKVILEKLRVYFDISEDLVEINKDLLNKIDKINKKKQILNMEIKEGIKAENKLEDEFFKSFNDKLKVIEESINKRFKAVGIKRKGKLRLIGNLNDLGIEIYVQFNDEVERKISSLSGGEQTMFAISLMLTLQELNPSPLCIFDEAQMFLDRENSQEVSKLIRNATNKGIQFIIILPDATKTILQLADSVIGIAKNGTEEISTVISLPKNIISEKKI